MDGLDLLDPLDTLLSRQGMTGEPCWPVRWAINKECANEALQVYRGLLPQFIRFSFAILQSRDTVCKIFDNSVTKRVVVGDFGILIFDF